MKKRQEIQNSRRKFRLLVILTGLLCILGAARVSAASVNVVKSAKTVSGGTWKETTSGRKYRYKSGSWAKNVWLKIGGKIYRFDSDGICQTGWITYKGNRYYADSKNGLYVSRFHKAKNLKCYFLSDGTLAVSRWVKTGGKYYYFVSTGRMVADTMFTVKGKTYYADASGVRAASRWVKQNGKKYYFNKNGVLQKNRWLKLDGKYYYVGSDGAMVTGKWIDGYYVSAGGARLTNCVIGGYYYDDTGKKTVKIFRGKYIFVGDSRIVGMSQAVSGTDTKFIGKVAAGLKWLTSTAGPELESYLKADPDVSVFLCFGINDMYNISSYITYYKKLIKNYPDTAFYIVSVNPIDETKAKRYGYKVTTAEIKSFNKQLYTAFSSSYLDCYQYLVKKKFETSDGIHYTAATYRKIYQYLAPKAD